jgi:hypothetical protein
VFYNLQFQLHNFRLMMTFERSSDVSASVLHISLMSKSEDLIAAVLRRFSFV